MATSANRKTHFVMQLPLMSFKTGLPKFISDTRRYIDRASFTASVNHRIGVLFGISSVSRVSPLELFTKDGKADGKA